MFVIGLAEDFLVATSVLQCRRAAALLCCRDVLIVLLKAQVPQVCSPEEVQRSLVQLELRAYIIQTMERNHGRHNETLSNDSLSNQGSARYASRVSGYAKNVLG